MAEVKLIRPPDRNDVTAYLRMLFLRTERELVNEIRRKRAAGYVDYAEVAALERVQRILQNMVDESWAYVPVMIEKIFYRTEAGAAGYANARTLTAPQTAVIQQLTDNLLGEIVEASETAQESVRELYRLGRLEADPYRTSALGQVLRQEASGAGWAKTSAEMMREMENKGITAFVDKAGRRWTLQDYCNMAVRTTARQTEVAAILTADDHDLWQIVKVGSTCPVCAALEGRVYSKSGADSDYPPLSVAFGKIDPLGGDDLTNTYLNIHPNCLHSLIKYTTIGKTEKQIQRDKDFSDLQKNPLNRDPRTKKQIAAYREKEKNRRRLLEDMRQHKEYRKVCGGDVPKSFEKFRDMKYNEPVKWKETQANYRKTNAYNKIVANEPEITADLTKISNDTGVSMVGLEHRIKTRESFLRKVGTDSNHSLDARIISDTIGSTNDVIRYTYQDTPLNLVDSYVNVTNTMKAKGYEAVRVKNTWLDRRSAYKGINCIFKSPSGQKFEIQFHTPESFKVKDGPMHKLYEEARKDTTSPERRAELNKKMFELSARLEVPANIERIR